MIVFKQVRLVNFLSHIDTTLKIRPGLHLVIGENKISPYTKSNGSGKSSIFEGIVYALYGGNERNWKRKGASTCFVELTIEYRETEYFIRRYYKDPIKGNGVEIYKNGQILPLRKNDANKFLESLLRLGKQNFISSVVIRQGFDVKLTVLTPTQRKEYFLEVIGYDFDEKLKKVKKAINQLQIEIQELESEIFNLRLNRNKLEGKIEVLVNAPQPNDPPSVNEITQQIRSLKERKEKIENAINSIQKKIGDLGKLEGKLSQKLQYFKKIQSQKICPLCKRPFDIDEEKIDNIQKQLERVEKEKRDLEAKMSKLVELKNKILDKLLNLTNQYTKLKEQKERLFQVKSLRVSLEKLTKEIQEKEKMLDILSIRLAKLKQLEDLLKPSGELRTIVLENIIALYNEFLKEISEYIGAPYLPLKLTPKGVEIDRDYSSLSGGEKRRVDIAGQLAFTQLLSSITGGDTNLLVLDETFHNLDRPAVEQILNYLEDHFPFKAIYVITHDESLKPLFTSVLKVVKDREGSKLVS